MLNLKGICDVEKISPGQTHGKYFGFVPTHLLPVLPSKSSPPPTGIIVEMLKLIVFQGNYHFGEIQDIR